MGITVNNLGKKRMIRPWIWSMIFSLIFSHFTWSQTSAEEFVAEDSIVYSFSKLGLAGQEAQPGWHIVDEPLPHVTPRDYGIQIQSTFDHPARAFEFMVPVTGNYRIKLSGYKTLDGGTAEVAIDGTSYGKYSFHTFTENYGSLIPIGTIYLTEGTHVLSLTLVDEGNG